ncbi:hypothetical protein A6R68_17869, partial [Neotoma lepida]
NEEIVVTGSPASLTVSQGERYQQKQRANLKLLICFISNLTSRIITHFSVSESVTSYSLTISNMEVEDAATYYRQQKNSVLFTRSTT